MVVIGQSGCIREKSGCNRTMYFYLGKNFCIWAKGLYSGKVNVIGQSNCIRAKTVAFGQSSCIRAKWLYSGKVDVFEQKWL